MTNHIATSEVLRQVVGGHWNYRSGRNLFECSPVPEAIALDIITRLGDWGIETERLLKNPSANTITLGIPAGQDLSVLHGQTMQESLLEFYARQNGIGLGEPHLG